MIDASQCIDCFHDNIDIVKRCNNGAYHPDKVYSSVYSCTLCANYYCEIDTFIGIKPFFFCKVCIDVAFQQFGLFFDNDELVKFFLRQRVQNPNIRLYVISFTDNYNDALDDYKRNAIMNKIVCPTIEDFIDVFLQRKAVKGCNIDKY